MVRKAAFIAVLLLPPSNSQLQINLATFISGLMLVYLALAMPFEESLLNFVEFANELCIYFTLVVLMALNTFSNSVWGSKLDQVGQYLIFVVCLTIVLNLVMLIYSLVQPFQESLKDRESTSLGRCLRYCCKVKLPESRKCFHDCCPCGDEAKEVLSKYPRTSFFAIQPFSCDFTMTTEAIDYSSSS